MDTDHLAFDTRVDGGSSPQPSAGQSAASGASPGGGGSGSAGERSDGGAQNGGAQNGGGISNGGNAAGGTAGNADDGGANAGGASAGSSGAAGASGASGGPGSIVYNLIARHSGKCFDAGSPDGNMYQWTCNDTIAQSFRVEPYADYFRIVNVGSGKCLRVNGTENSTNVDEYTCNEHSNKQWTLEEIAGGYVRLRNRFASKCAHVQAGGLSNGTNIYAWPCGANTTSEWYRQHWSLIEL